MSAAVESLLRIGDNGLVLSHRLQEAVGRLPILEEELASANVALDLLGQARLWLALAGEIEGEGRDADALAFFRDVRAFHNALLTEQPNGDFAFIVARQFFFDAWHYQVLRALSRAADHRVREIASKALKEVAYHVRRSGDWVVRLGDGTEESHQRMQAAVDELWPYVDELFTDDDVDVAAHAAGVGVLHAPLRAAWDTLVRDTLAAATLTVPPASKWPQRGGKQGRHSEHLGYILADLQYMQRAYPGLAW
ncbi:1,2-phenylacetyl-CoA epoxidase subunit PaaC [Gemmatimonas aurantiaca]|uniref:1,2-phenylacetyl-CoA epoxidase subunit PaaC n=1 Tax=Gemmatimonas aurantiaca TaxID=173480 RepID=UPI00301DA28C